MMRIFKKLMFSPIVMVALLVAAAGIKPASMAWLYQPAPPIKPE